MTSKLALASPRHTLPPLRGSDIRPDAMTRHELFTTARMSPFSC